MPIATSYRDAPDDPWKALPGGVWITSRELHGESREERIACACEFWPFHFSYPAELLFPDHGEDGKGGVWSVASGWRSWTPPDPELDL